MRKTVSHAEKLASVALLHRCILLRRKSKEESGYSLIEVLAAIVLLSLAILPMVSMFDAGLEAASTGGNYDKARALANSNLEAIKAETAKANDGPCPVPGEDPLNECNVTIENANVASDRKSSKFGSGGDINLTKVKVTVEWDNGKEYVAAGVVARDGSE